MHADEASQRSWVKLTLHKGPVIGPFFSGAIPACLPVVAGSGDRDAQAMVMAFGGKK
jgi:hypothetical protein